MTDARRAPSPAADPVVPVRRTLRSHWPRAALAVSSIAIAGAGLLATTELHGFPALHAP